MSKTLSLGFVQRDVTTQLRTAGQLLDVAERLNVLATRIADQDIKSGIENDANALVLLADELVTTASQTGRTVAEFLSPAA